MNVKKYHLTAAIAAGLAFAAVAAPQAGAQASPVICDGLEATIVGTPGDDVIFGTDGDDVIALLQGNDYVFAGGGDDVICGGLGNDTLLGGEGFDVLFGAQGNDVIAGNWNIDEFVVPEELIDDTAGMRAFGGTGNDTIIGTNRWDRMQGGPGNDTLLGYDGRDRLRGGPGLDLLVGHAGIDDIGAGPDNDTISADRLDINVRGAGGFDTCSTITNRAVRWLGCEDTFPTNPVNPLLPAEAFPAQLGGGVANTYVSAGTVGTGQAPNSIVFLVDDTRLMIGGASFDLSPLATTSNISTGDPIHLQPVTQGQAQAIGEALIVRRNLDGRWDHVLDPDLPYYDAAVAWGDRWITLNTAE